MTYKPMLITVNGMSGVGKDSIIQGVMKIDSKVKEYTSTTTRAPRPGDIEGVHYHFLSREEFLKRVKNDEFYEHDEHHGNIYGAQKVHVEAVWAKGCDAISDSQSDGMFTWRRILPERAFAILIMPPSRERLYQRLTQRNPELSEDGKRRFKAAEPDLAHLTDPFYVFTNPDMRGSKLTDYDAVFVNDDLEVTVYAVAKRIAEEREKRGG